MGANSSASNDEYEATKEKPLEGVEATLYYFGGRGLADPIRWMLAAANISFGQKVVDTREYFLKLAARQLPFGALPLLQIDGIEIVQSKAIIRAIAKRSRLCGRDNEEEIKCDMVAEMVSEILGLAVRAPFARNSGEEAGQKHIAAMKEKWNKYAPRLEAVLAANGGIFMVGDRMTYADVLVVHCLTCYAEECGPDVTENMPLLVDLQHRIISLPQIQAFIKNNNLYYPIGDAAYCQQVSTVLGRKILV